MTSSHRQPPSTKRIAAAVLAAVGATSAIPIPLAQLDFAGLINVLNIDNGDSPQALLVIAGVGGILTFAVLVLALAGAFLAVTGAPSAHTLLLAAALAGLATAMPLWIPTGAVIGAAAILVDRSDDRYASGGHSRRNLLATTGVSARMTRE